MTGSKPTFSGGFYQAGKDRAGLVEEAERAVSQGYRGMKMKIGRNPSTQSNLREMLPHHDMCGQPGRRSGTGGGSTPGPGPER